MCGHVGVAGDILQLDKDVFTTLLFVDQLRGMDSTGVMASKMNGEVNVHTSVQCATTFIHSKEYSEALIGNLNVLLGHNRAATVGKIKHENVHPFIHGNIVGAHNGTLRRMHLLDDYKDFEVDSDCIFFNIHKNGLRDTVKKLDGAFALVYYDTKEQKLVFIRNKERSFFYCFSTDKKRLYWASEKEMLNFALDRKNIVHTPIVSTVPGSSYTFSVPTKWNTPFEEPVIEELELYTLPQSNYAGYLGGNQSVTPFPRRNAGNSAEQPKGRSGSKVGLLPNSMFPDDRFYFGITDLMLESNCAYLKGFLKDPKQEEGLQYCEVRFFESLATKDIFDKVKASFEMGDENSTVAIFSAECQIVRTYKEIKYLVPAANTIKAEGFMELTDFFVDEELRLDDPCVLNDSTGVLMPISQYRKLIQKGCAWCSTVDYTFGNAVFISRDEHVCKSCAEMAEVKPYLAVCH